MISENIATLRARIRDVSLKCKRNPSEIKIIGITKSRAIDQLQEAFASGIEDFGENKVQEASLKHRGFPQAIWHMVGHLQTNKVKDAVNIFNLIQSVDSLALAVAIDKEAFKIGKVQEILLEIKISPEEAKFGFDPQDFRSAFDRILQLKNLKIKGLMGIAPLVNNPQDARPFFRVLKKIRDDIDGNLILSMGMTDDFEIAIEEGSDMIRIGRGIFGV